MSQIGQTILNFYKIRDFNIQPWRKTKEEVSLSIESAMQDSMSNHDLDFCIITVPFCFRISVIWSIKNATTNRVFKP